MRAQGSVEFIIILAAVAALSVSVLAIYANTQAAGDAAYNAIANSFAFQTSNSQALQLDPFVYAYLSNTTYVNRSNSLSIVSYLPQSYSIWLQTNSTDGSAIPANYLSGGRIGFTNVQGYVVPAAAGPYSVTVEAGVEHGNDTFTKNITLESYALLPAPTGATTTIPTSPYLYASIERHNESLVYPPSAWSPVYNMTITSRCSEENFFYQQEPIWVQCGAAHWYFFVFSDGCYSQGVDTATYCVYLNANKSGYSQLQSQPAYSYNITLDIYQSNQSGKYQANLTSSAQNAILYGGANGAGYALVANSIYATSPLSYQNELLLNLSGNEIATNASGYFSYQQALTSAQSILAYYNNSDAVGDSGLQSIGQAISTLNSQAYKFASQARAANVSGCALSRSGNYLCDPVGAFDYANITARMGSLPASNETLDVDGSVIHIEK